MWSHDHWPFPHADQPLSSISGAPSPCSISHGKGHPVSALIWSVWSHSIDNSHACIFSISSTSSASGPAFYFPPFYFMVSITLLFLMLHQLLFLEKNSSPNIQFSYIHTNIQTYKRTYKHIYIYIHSHLQRAPVRDIKNNDGGNGISIIRACE